MHVELGANHSLTIRVRAERRPGMLARIATVIGETGGLVGSIPIVKVEKNHTVRDIDIYCSGENHEQRAIEAVKALPYVEVIDITDRTFRYHKGGKIGISSTKRLGGSEELSMAYTPGVGRVSMAIARDPDKVYEYTSKGNKVSFAPQLPVMS